MKLNDEALALAYEMWEPYRQTPADESVVCFGDITSLVAHADDTGVLPISLAAHDVGMDRIVLMWTISEELWLQLWDGELADLTTEQDGLGRTAVRRLFENIADIAEAECRRISRSPMFEAVRKALDAVQTAKASDSNDAVDDAARDLSEEVVGLLGRFEA